LVFLWFFHFLKEFTRRGAANEQYYPANTFTREAQARDTSVKIDLMQILSFLATPGNLTKKAAAQKITKNREMNIV